MVVVRSAESTGEGAIDILIEVDNVARLDDDHGYGRPRAGGTDKIIGQVNDLFGDGLQLARDCARQVVDAIKDFKDEHRPTEFEIALAIALDAEVGAVLVKTSANAQLQVSMTWKQPERS